MAWYIADTVFYNYKCSYNSWSYCFCSDDRVNDYQHYALDAVKSCAANSPDMGAQVRTI